MHPLLFQDREDLLRLLEHTCKQASDFLHSLPTRPVARSPYPSRSHALPEHGLGAQAALDLFQQSFEDNLSGSAGPRYFGFVTGGTTPAALAADWLVSAYDQNSSDLIGSVATAVELEAIELLKQLFGLPAAFSGCFVSGATMANFVGLGCARQWVGEKLGHDIAEDGLTVLPPLSVLAATPHASAIKALAMLGLGRQAIVPVATLPGREAIDPDALEQALLQARSTPAIVLASACTVNTADFDNLEAVSRLCRTHQAWLHVDAAFGLFAACTPATALLLAGIEQADSIASDGHKWLNVPYDSGFVFTRHPALQERVFRASAPYLSGGDSSLPNLLNRTPENSRRFRALPAWATLMAYGREGYRELVERNCWFAASLGRWLDTSEHFELLAPVRLNIVCFRLSDSVLAGHEEQACTRSFLSRLNADGRVLLTPTTYAGRAGLRAAISNWSTTEADLEVTVAALAQTVTSFSTT